MERPQYPPLDERIKSAVDRNLSARGLRKISEGIAKPEILVNYRYGVHKTIESDDVGTNVGFGGWWGGGVFGGLGVGTGRDIHTRYEGVLLINMIDAQSSQTIWRGKGTHRVEEHWKPETKTERINELVEKVLVQFPPMKKGG